MQHSLPKMETAVAAVVVLVQVVAMVAIKAVLVRGVGVVGRSPAVDGNRFNNAADRLCRSYEGRRCHQWLR
jgi:hypothetical protein